MAEFGKSLNYVGRLQKAQRLMKSALYRTDPKLAIRELCEAIDELTNALLEREQSAQPATPDALSTKPAG